MPLMVRIFIIWLFIMKTKINRIGIIGLLVSCILTTCVAFANITITQNVFDSIQWSDGSFAYVWYSWDYNGSWMFIFWNDTITWNYSIILSGYDQNLACHEQLIWYYINPFWWDGRIWPLSANSLQTLAEEDPNFEGLNIDGWLFTSCEGEQIDPFAIFGYIEYDYTPNDTSSSLDNQETGYKIWAGISWLNTDTPSFANALFLLWWWSGSDVSASWWIFDSVSNTGIVVPNENGNFSEHRIPYLWDQTINFRFIDPAYFSWNNWYTTWETVKVRMSWITWYHWQLSGDLMETLSWDFSTANIEKSVTLTNQTWSKSINFSVSANDNWEWIDIHSSDYQITLLWADEWWNGIPNTESWSVSCTWEWPDPQEILTGGSTIFGLTCTWTSALTGEISSWNIHIAGYTGGSINSITYQSLDNINITFTAWSTTWTASLSLNGNSICLANNMGICNGVYNSYSVVITWNTTSGWESEDPEEPSWTKPNIAITTQPSTGWSQNKIINAYSTNYSGFQYIITASDSCDWNISFNWANSYNWWNIELNNEYYNWKYICFRAWNSYWTWYARSDKIENIDKTKPVCSRWEPSKTELIVWETWVITLTCVDTWAWIETSSLLSSSLSATYGVLSFSNATVSWNPSSKNFSFIYTALNVWETTISILDNKIRDGAWNSNIGVSSPEITVTEEDNPWHNSASCEKLFQFTQVPYSSWTQSDTVEVELFCWSTWRWAFSTTNIWVDIFDGTWFENGHLLLTTTWESFNGKYVCIYSQTWERVETGCTEYPFMIDAFAPDIQLKSPNNWTSFESGDVVTLSRTGYDSTSWISGYTLEISKPNGSNIVKYFDNITTSTWIIVDIEWRWHRYVTAYDNAWRSEIGTRFFDVTYSGWSNSWNSNSWNIETWETITWFSLITPALFDRFSLWNDIIFKWNSWELNSWYLLNVNKIWWDTIFSGFITWTSITLSWRYFNTGAYSWSVEDIASSNIEAIALFYVVDIENLPDLEVDQFEFYEIDDAEINEYYKSNSITIDWLENWWYSLAYLKDNIWALYINWDFVWTQWFVTNDDKVRIELKASNEYNTTVSTKLIIGSGSNLVSGDFKITTKDWINGWNDPLLTPLQRLWWIIFVDSLVEMYQNNPEKLATFLATFMQLLQDKSDYYGQEISDAQLNWDNELANEYRTYKNAVDFLYTIVKYRYDNLNVEDRTVYIAPNGKQYLVEYDEDRMAYTSPDFARPKYFPTRELFTNHIDINNPAVWKWWIVWNVITTHNGKIYTIYETNWKWTSSNFKTAKYFDTKEDIINHILANNPASNWNHTVDPDFEQVVYTAPNGKVYKIFKTSSKWNNPNMYSSYNFVDAKYFTSLEAAKKFIDQSNPKR